MEVSRHAASRALAALAFVLALLPVAAGGQPPAAAPAPELSLVSPDAGRVDWAPRGEWIAYDRVDDEGYSRLYVARPDSTQKRCLTCQPLEFRRHHTGNPTWHPSGDYLVFEVEKPFKRAGEPEPFLRVPGRNLGNDLWAIRFDGRTFFRLTSHVERGTGRVHSPRFSHEGDRLVWAERVATGRDWGEWELRVAEISFRRGVPRLKRIRPAGFSRDHRYVEPYGFTTDDRGLLVAAGRPAGGPETGLDLFLVRLEGGELTRLTDDVARVNRFARLAPNGRWLVWATDREQPGSRPGSAPALDLWMMRGDGRDARRLTRFSDVFAPGYAGPVAVRSAAWSPEGDRLLILAAPLDGSTSGSLYLVLLDEPYGR